MEKREKKKTNGNANREKGHNAERYYAAEFRRMGHARCATSRYASRMHDDAGIDLVGVPFNVQVKAGRQARLRPAQVLAEMKERVARAFPEGSPERVWPSILVHRGEPGRGKRRREEDDIVHLTFADFKKVIGEKTETQTA